jgi:hypothetical protein
MFPNILVLPFFLLNGTEGPEQEIHNGEFKYLKDKILPAGIYDFASNTLKKPCYHIWKPGIKLIKN